MILYLIGSTLYAVFFLNVYRTGVFNHICYPLQQAILIDTKIDEYHYMKNAT